MRLRIVPVACGVLASAYGARSLLGEAPRDLPDAGLWLAGGVVLHDFVLAPVVLLGALALRRWLPPSWRSPLVVAGLVLGSTTLVAIPVLGRFGARPDNPSLLDRNYVAGWFGLGRTRVAGRGWSRPGATHPGDEEG
ncbi:hypothetical protein [Nocardioides sp. B-3]|uniref:hypothetical protein n=1 Tax=Nocardioides sp. B-3 TaxID=2895565 RepID=UPI0021520E87|nr:hypothetical protein [Nocardioides sp. B-3]UUZ59308.1 hypothetical protein LP418_26210 [Nocardioides sp. B-3]